MTDLMHHNQKVKKNEDLEDDEDDATDMKNHCLLIAYFFPIAAVASARAH